MKNFNILETSILGFLIGVVASTYMIFIISTDGFVGNILNWLSLRPILDIFDIPDDKLILISFFFFIVVYTLHGLIIGLIIKNNLKILLSMVIIIISTISLVCFEQIKGSKDYISSSSYGNEFTSSVINSISKKQKQYFGNEARGDLNSDNKEDVAFLLKRNDKDRGELYYLSASLATSTGYSGLNIIFLGEKIRPDNLSISNDVISIYYLNTSENTSTTSRVMYTKIIDGELRFVDKPLIDYSSISTTTENSVL